MIFIYCGLFSEWCSAKRKKPFLLLVVVFAPMFISIFYHEGLNIIEEYVKTDGMYP